MATRLPDNQTLQWTGAASGVLVVSKSVGAVPAIERRSVMPQQETPPLDYQATTTVQRVRPKIWLAQMVGAAAVCVVALSLDWRGRFGSYPSDPTPYVEFAAAVYGLICAAVCLKRGALRVLDVAAMIVCVLVFAVAFYAGGLMYRTLMYPMPSY